MAIRSMGSAGPLEFGPAGQPFKAFAHYARIMDSMPTVASDLAKPLSLYACYFMWRNHRLGAAARLPLPLGVEMVQPSSLPANSVFWLSVWLFGSDFYRVEYRGGRHDGAIGISRGRDWWAWEPTRSTPLSGRREHAAIPPPQWLGHGPRGRLLDPDLGNALHIEQRTAGWRAGRRAIIIDAQPADDRTDASTVNGVLRFFGAGATRYRIALDCRYRILLEAIAYLDEEPFQSIEAKELRTDTHLDDRLFLPPEP
jgi:hypothetical protein